MIQGKNGLEYYHKNTISLNRKILFYNIFMNTSEIQAPITKINKFSERTFNMLNRVLSSAKSKKNIGVKQLYALILPKIYSD